MIDFWLISEFSWWIIAIHGGSWWGFFDGDFTYGWFHIREKRSEKRRKKSVISPTKILAKIGQSIRLAFSDIWTSFFARGFKDSCGKPWLCWKNPDLVDDVPIRTCFWKRFTLYANLDTTAMIHILWLDHIGMENPMEKNLQEKQLKSSWFSDLFPPDFVKRRPKTTPPWPCQMPGVVIRQGFDWCPLFLWRRANQPKKEKVMVIAASLCIPLEASYHGEEIRTTSWW